MRKKFGGSLPSDPYQLLARQPRKFKHATDAAGFHLALPVVMAVAKIASPVAHASRQFRHAASKAMGNQVDVRDGAPEGTYTNSDEASVSFFVRTNKRSLSVTVPKTAPIEAVIDQCCRREYGTGQGELLKWQTRFFGRHRLMRGYGRHFSKNRLQATVEDWNIQRDETLALTLTAPGGTAAIQEAARICACLKMCLEMPIADEQLRANQMEQYARYRDKFLDLCAEAGIDSETQQLEEIAPMQIDVPAVPVVLQQVDTSNNWQNAPPEGEDSDNCDDGSRGDCGDSPPSLSFLL